MHIYITWPGGSGKSTLARKLSQQLHIPVIHLDELLWNPDWTENPNYGNLQREAIAQENWIIEWPSCSIVKSMPVVDRIIILDFPPLGNAMRIIRRYLKSRFSKTERIGLALPDRIDLRFFVRNLFWRKRQLPRLLENIRQLELSEKLLVLRDPTSEVLL